MASCPNCHNQIDIREEHFGTLFQCANCKSEFFVDFSGVPEDSKSPLSLSDEISILKKPRTDVSEIKPQEEPIDHSFNLDPILTQNPIEDSEFKPAEALAIETVSNQEQAANKNSFEEIVDFGNDLQNRGGVLTIDLTIDEIDLPEQKSFLIECIEDTRLGLDADEVKEKIKNGKIEIHNYPVPKAIVLTQRLQGLALKIYWRDHVATK